MSCHLIQGLRMAFCGLLRESFKVHWAQSPIPPALVNTNGMKEPFLDSLTLSSYMSLFSFSCSWYIYIWVSQLVQVTLTSMNVFSKGEYTPTAEMDNLASSCVLAVFLKFKALTGSRDGSTLTSLHLASRLNKLEYIWCYHVSSMSKIYDQVFFVKLFVISIYCTRIER